MGLRGPKAKDYTKLDRQVKRCRTAGMTYREMMLRLHVKEGVIERSLLRQKLTRPSSPWVVSPATLLHDYYNMTNLQLAIKYDRVTPHIYAKMRQLGLPVGKTHRKFEKNKAGFAKDWGRLTTKELMIKYQHTGIQNWKLRLGLPNLYTNHREGTIARVREVI